jgi:hypothetical protein
MLSVLMWLYNGWYAAAIYFIVNHPSLIFHYRGFIVDVLFQFKLSHCWMLEVLRAWHVRGRVLFW